MEQSLSRPVQPHSALSRGDRISNVPVEDVAFPDPVLLGRRAVVGIESVKARLEKSIVRELDASIPQGKADQTGGIDD